MAELKQNNAKKYATKSGTCLSINTSSIGTWFEHTHTHNRCSRSRRSRRLRWSKNEFVLHVHAKRLRMPQINDLHTDGNYLSHNFSRR